MTEAKQKAKILNERAKQLRQPKIKEVNTQDFLDGLTFSLDKEIYFVGSAYISEVIRIHEITPLPCSPEFIFGIINIRGRIISVVDFKRFLGLKSGEPQTLKNVIVLRNADIEFGILVDVILGYTKLNPRKIQKANAFEGHQSKGFIKGITDDKIIILETEKLIANEKIIVNEQV